MTTVAMTAGAEREYQDLPLTIRRRVAAIVARLASWPAVAGAKPMQGELAGSFRIRTGDWRIVFTVRGDLVLITKIGHRSVVYDD